MTEFHELDLQKDVASMEEEEAKETLSDFMEAHQKNQTAYDELSEERDEIETEYQEKLEEREELISEFKQERAEEAAEYVNMPADLLVDRFSLDEIDTIIEEGSEADFSEDEPEDEPEDEQTLTTFSEKPEKGRRESNDSFGDTERAKSKLHQQW